MALGWLGATVAVIAMVAGMALWEPKASAQGIKAPGSIGSDGWIPGDHYDVRLIPNWYDIGSASRPGLQDFYFPLDGGYIALATGTANPAEVAPYRSELRRLGAHTAVLEGAQGLRLARSGLAHNLLEEWFVVRGRVYYLVALYGSAKWPQDSAYLENACAYILRSWRWTS